MPLKLTGRHLEISDDLREAIEGATQRYHKHTDRISLIEVTLTKEHRQCKADILVKDGRAEYHASHTNEEAKHAFDGAHHRIIAQIDKRKGRVLGRKKGATGHRQTNGPPEEAASFVQSGGLPAWIHPEEIDLQPYTVEKALEKLKQLEHRAFFVFIHSQSRKINVIFRRQDGEIGLIAT